MAVYVIATYDITNPEHYEAYVQGIMPLLMKHAGEVLVADYEAKAIEGSVKNANILIKFQREEDAMAWYNDPDYAPFKKIRMDSTTNASLFITKEFVMPNPT